jgi:hypothetical protein
MLCLLPALAFNESQPKHLISLVQTLNGCNAIQTPVLNAEFCNTFKINTGFSFTYKSSFGPSPLIMSFEMTVCTRPGNRWWICKWEKQTAVTMRPSWSPHRISWVWTEFRTVRRRPIWTGGQFWQNFCNLMSVLAFLLLSGTLQVPSALTMMSFRSFETSWRTRRATQLSSLWSWTVYRG